MQETPEITRVEPWLQPAKPELVRPVDAALIEAARSSAQNKIDEITHRPAEEPSRLAIVGWLLWRLPKLIGLFIKIKGAFAMGMDLKTTITGLVGALAYILAMFGLHLPQDVGTGIVAVTVFLVGLFAKDKNTPAA